MFIYMRIKCVIISLSGSFAGKIVPEHWFSFYLKTKCCFNLYHENLILNSWAKYELKSIWKDENAWCIDSKSKINFATLQLVQSLLWNLVQSLAWIFTGSIPDMETILVQYPTWNLVQSLTWNCTGSIPGI